MPEIDAAEVNHGHALFLEPNMFGTMPSQGFNLRHMKNVELSDIEVAAISPDARPAFVLQNAEGADFFHVKTPTGTPAIVLHDSKDVQVRWVRGVKDGVLA